MIITIESTTKVVQLSGSYGEPVPARIWEGKTESGIKVHCYITRIAVEEDEPRTEEFEQELMQCRTPSAGVLSIPLRLIL